VSLMSRHGPPFDSPCGGGLPFGRTGIAKLPRVRDLEARLAERDAGLRSEGESLAPLARAAEENGPPLMWRETWDATVHYIPGEVVLQSGGLWVCKQRCAAVKPGTSRDSWKLIIKSADSRGWSRERAGAR
jgi:hypothetical protein